MGLNNFFFFRLDKNLLANRVQAVIKRVTLMSHASHAFLQDFCSARIHGHLSALCNSFWNKRLRIYKTPNRRLEKGVRIFGSSNISLRKEKVTLMCLSSSEQSR